MTEQELKEFEGEFLKREGEIKEILGDAGFVSSAALLNVCVAVFRMGWASRTAPEWQPIETAPKDGSKILIYDGDDIYAAWWEPKFHLGVSENAEEFTYLGAWTDDAVASFNYEETFEYQPTHWMPLPAEPKRGE